jgi:endosialidase-like protein
MDVFKVTAGAQTLVYSSGGSLGIGSTTPWKTLSVVGTMAINGLTNDTADSKTLCLTASNEVVSNSGSTCITSSQRFKNTILSLDDASGLAEILKLNPVSFHYNDNVGIPGEQVGFIAEQVQQVDQRLVVLDASGTPFTVRYEQLTSLLAKAIQQIATITGTFKATLVSWLGSTENGIGDFFAGAGHFSNELCVGSTCVTPAQFQAMVAAAGTQSLAGSGAAGGPFAPAAGTNTNTATTTTATLTVNGNNPAQWPLNEIWNDNLGALFTHGGQSETIYSTTTVDTTQTGTTTLDYWAEVPTTEHWLHTTRDVRRERPR